MSSIKANQVEGGQHQFYIEFGTEPDEFFEKWEDKFDQKIGEKEYLGQEENGDINRYSIIENFPVNLYSHNYPRTDENLFENAYKYIKQEIEDNIELIEDYESLFEKGEHRNWLVVYVDSEPRAEDREIEFRLRDKFKKDLPVKGLLHHIGYLEQLFGNLEKPEEDIEGLREAESKIIYDGEMYDGEIKSYSLKDALEVGLWLNGRRKQIEDTIDSN